MSPRNLTSPTGKPIRLPAIRPNPGLQVKYQTQLDRMIDAMQRDVAYTVRRQWRLNTPEMAGDESPAAGLRRMMGRLARQWSARFADFASTWSRKFTAEAAAGADRSFSAALRKAGFTVKFQMTAAANDVMQATIGEQIGLIRSIPQQYLKDVEGYVMRSVQTGRALAGLTADLEHNYGVTRRRAAFIARDQNNKATATITRVRQQELGITHATWLHSAGGKQPRPTHVAQSGKPYVIAEGWLDPAIGKRIWPGTEINCRCAARSIIPGL